MKTIGTLIVGITIGICLVFLLASPLNAESSGQVSTLTLFKEILERLDRIEASMTESKSHRSMIDELNCEYVEMKNPEAEKYYKGFRVYDNYETMLACLLHRNPPGHTYQTATGKAFTNVEDPVVEGHQFHMHDDCQPHIHGSAPSPDNERPVTVE